MSDITITKAELLVALEHIAQAAERAKFGLTGSTLTFANQFAAELRREPEADDKQLQHAADMADKGWCQACGHHRDNHGARGAVGPACSWIGCACKEWSRHPLAPVAPVPRGHCGRCDRCGAHFGVSPWPGRGACFRDSCAMRAAPLPTCAGCGAPYQTEPPPQAATPAPSGAGVSRGPEPASPTPWRHNQTMTADGWRESATGKAGDNPGDRVVLISPKPLLGDEHDAAPDFATVVHRVNNWDVLLAERDAAIKRGQIFRRSAEEVEEKLRAEIGALCAQLDQCLKSGERQVWNALQNRIVQLERELAKRQTSGEQTADQIAKVLIQQAAQRTEKAEARVAELEKERSELLHVLDDASLLGAGMFPHQIASRCQALLKTARAIEEVAHKCACGLPTKHFSSEELRAEYRAGVESIYKQAGVASIFMEKLPNGYCSEPCCLNRPWFRVTSSIGHVVIGWRKRVIAIDWKDTAIKDTGHDLFPSEDVTRLEHGIHAWGEEKAVEYIARLHRGKA